MGGGGYSFRFLFLIILPSLLVSQIILLLMVFFSLYLCENPSKMMVWFSLYISSCLWYDKLILGWEGKITPGHPGDTISPKWVVFQNGL